MIVHTLTSNLLAETTYTLASWEEGATQRSSSETFQAGGKGINVAHMLMRLGVESEALLFPGGDSGRRCENWLKQKGIRYRVFSTRHDTRTGAVVRAAGRQETTFLGAENDISPESIKACADYLSGLDRQAIVHIGGSIPYWTEPRWDSLRDALDGLMPGHKVFVDTYGPPLCWFAERDAALIKINRKEFAGIAGEEVTALTEVNMPELLHKVATNSKPRGWIITDGPNPVWSTANGGTPTSAKPPVIEEVSQTGSGDVFFAACIYALETRGMLLQEAVRFALPIAAANAAEPGVAEFDLAPFGL